MKTSLITLNTSTTGSLSWTIRKKPWVSLWFRTEPKGSPNRRWVITSMVRYWIIFDISRRLVSFAAEVHSLSTGFVHSVIRVSRFGSTDSMSLPLYYGCISPSSTLTAFTCVPTPAASLRRSWSCFHWFCSDTTLSLRGLCLKALKEALRRYGDRASRILRATNGSLSSRWFGPMRVRGPNVRFSVANGHLSRASTISATSFYKIRCRIPIHKHSHQPQPRESYKQWSRNMTQSSKGSEIREQGTEKHRYDDQEGNPAENCQRR